MLSGMFISRLYEWLMVSATHYEHNPNTKPNGTCTGHCFIAKDLVPFMCIIRHPSETTSRPNMMQSSSSFSTLDNEFCNKALFRVHEYM